MTVQQEFHRADSCQDWTAASKKSLLALEYEVTPARNAWVYLRAKVVNVVFWLRTMGLMASFHRPSCPLYHWP